ncbi:YggS family pyridoxal phosphate-dependent enzyme [Methylacidimicrobium sp. B4]|uniref:YggS family pyridoxal phosphate-dependent enzyme n=1 Tax=Methylacidimicrobium sp. B4 TaxID=2796139 RepID=UPI001A907781|nr:YggS family pyridoxal phosphate-dependent enzyme [Methylacidimicrobium sp. B4]QSR83844.1 YggS family pyridoxal phosphate-dependent enzyme [Methylacidimicrobium sp. B4]
MDLFEAATLPDRLSLLQQRIEIAAGKSGRLPGAIRLIAATKSHPPEVLAALFALGIQDVGENRVQEAAAKREVLGSKGTWHFIGHLQKNKANTAAHLFDWVQSLDSLELAQALSRGAAILGRRISVLIQVNISGERSKFGAPSDAAQALAREVNALSGLELHGFFTIAPFTEDPEASRPIFAGLRTLRDRVEKETGLALPVLSMGMSHDFMIAIEEGSTMIRIGTALLGPRQAHADR